MQRILFIGLLTLLGAVSCTNVETTGGRLRIQFETGALQTKAGEPDGVVSDGGGIALDEGNPDIVILGARTAEQLEQNLSPTLCLTETELSDLSRAAAALDRASLDVCDNIFSYRW